MPKATLTFDLPEEQSEFKDAVNGTHWKIVASELDEWLRRRIKYEDDNAVQVVRDELNELINGRGLSLWD